MGLNFPENILLHESLDYTVSVRTILLYVVLNDTGYICYIGTRILCTCECKNRKFGEAWFVNFYLLNCLLGLYHISITLY